MKKLISALLVSAMLIGGTSSFATAIPSPADEGIALKDGALLKIDETSGRLILLDGPVTVAKLKSGIATDVTVKGEGGRAKADSDAVANGDTVSAGDSSLTVLLYGDVNCDGRIDLNDAVLTLRYVAGQNVNIDTLAADVETDAKADTVDIDAADAVKLLRAIAGWEVSLGDLRMMAENKAKVAEAEESAIDVFFETPLRKIGRSITESTGKLTYKMTLARNETESAQMFLAADKDFEGLSVEMSEWEYEFGGHEGVLTGEILWEYYYDISYRENVLWYTNGPTISYHDYHVDALPPVADTFELTGGRSQGFMINVTSSKDAPAGMYRAAVDIKNSEGQVIKSAYVYAYVWDFTLPDTPYSASSYNISMNEVFRHRSGKDPEPYKTYYDFMLGNNLSAYNIPYHVVDERADAYMSDPRVTSFVIAGTADRYAGEMWRDEDEVVAGYQKVQTNAEWAKKGYFYYLDEPWGPNGANSVKEHYEWLADLLGTEDFRFGVPFGDTVVDEITSQDMLDFMQPYVNLWMPSAGVFVPFAEYNYEPYRWIPTAAYFKYGQEETSVRYNRLREDPKNELWWYNVNGFPWPNYSYNHAGVMIRVILWQQYLFDLDGILYYLVNNWEKVSRYQTENDGCMIYWGQLFGFEEGPVSSYRLIQTRDSFDDFDYMRMVEERYDRETALGIAQTVTTGVLNVNEDPNNMIAAREALAALLEGTD